jgi:hypothetical protein
VEEIHGVGDEGSGDTTRVDVQTLFEAFLNMSVTAACFIDEAFFLVKRKTSGFGTTVLKYWIIRISKLSDVRVKEFSCTC